MTSDGHVNCKGAGVCLPVSHVSKRIEQTLYRCRVRMVGVVEVVSGPGRCSISRGQKSRGCKMRGVPKP